MTAGARRALLVALGLVAAAAITWRLTLGTPEALGDLAERRERAARPGDTERVLRAERDVANGTGPYGYGNVIQLIVECQRAVRDELQRYSHVELDAGMPPERSHVYVQRFRDQRIVGLMRTAPRDGSEDAREYPALMPPLDGAYVVIGYVAYSNRTIQPGTAHDAAQYQCSVNVSGARIRVSDVKLGVVR